MSSKSIPLINLPVPPPGRVAVPMLFALSGCFSLAVAAVLLASWADQIVGRRGWDTAHALGLTHLAALGFGSSVAMGVSYHLAPQTFGSPRPNQPLGIALWLCFTLSMAGFVVA